MTEHELTKRIMTTMRMHRRVVESMLGQTGLHQAQHRLLMCLAHRHCGSQVELAKHMEVTPATIAVSLKSLEREGYILRNSKKEDNRFNHIEITEKGQKVVEESKLVFSQIDSDMFAGISEVEKDQLADIMGKIRDNLEKQIQRKGSDASETVR